MIKRRIALPENGMDSGHLPLSKCLILRRVEKLPVKTRGMGKVNHTHILCWRPVWLVEQAPSLVEKRNGHLFVELVPGWRWWFGAHD